MAAMSAKKKVPAVLKHYEVPKVLPAENFKAKCKYCTKEITGSVRTTTNWWKHMRRVHATLLKEQQDEDESQSNSQQTLTHLLQPQRKYSSQHPKQILVTDAVVDFVADDLIPLSVVESKRFKSLLRILDSQYQVPSRKQLSTVLLKKKYDKLKSSVLDKLKKTDTINLTIDLWSNRQMRSYLGITGHYISDDWNLESVMLACNQVSGRHIGDNIMMWYDEIISDFGVREEVKHIITDSASNVKKAFLTLPGYEDVEDHTASDDSEAEGESEFERCDNVSLDESQVLFEHHACFAHVLQLVVKDGMAKAGQINTVIKRCSSLVSFVRRSTVAADVLKDETRLQADNTTRWNSQLKMIRSVLAVSDSVLSQLENAPKLTTHEKNLLQDIVEILTPFEEATEFVQVGCVPSAGYVLPCIRGLYHHIENMVSKYHSGLVRGLKQSLHRRMPYYEENETYIVACILDPRFKLRWCSDDAERDRSLDLLKAVLERLSPAVSTVAVLQADENSEPPPKKKRKSLFNFMYDNSHSPSIESQQLSTVTKQVDEYIETDTLPMTQNPTKYWQDNQKKYTVLSRLAKDVLGVPSSSAPVERLFSVAGKVFTPERCCLTDGRFSQLMFIRCNQNYIMA
ncbi:zinc finger BED domain-containing protein 4-like [Dysidea avara]|uniref:zinc finger BED domain-containing protein 4-like n=1 Tax=Dysidea avara TaxID=196820 RepID=UPI0033316B96